jgi:hypothetical protein
MMRVEDRTMLMVVLSCVFGALGAMAVWAAMSVRSTVDEIMRRGGEPYPIQEP